MYIYLQCQIKDAGNNNICIFICTSMPSFLIRIVKVFCAMSRLYVLRLTGMPVTKVFLQNQYQDFCSSADRDDNPFK